MSDIQTRTMEKAFYLQTKAFLEKNSEHIAEIARLKAEVERLKEGNECLDQMHEKEMARSAFLCEEVNRTTAWGRGLESDLSWARAELMQVKAELERVRLIAHDNKQALYNAKAEVERLTNNCNYLDKKLDEELDKSAILCGQVERLTKAGDAMLAEWKNTQAGHYSLDEAEPAWNAAKEGKTK